MLNHSWRGLQQSNLEFQDCNILGCAASTLDRMGNSMILTGAAATGLSHYLTRMFGDALPDIMAYEKEQAKLVSLLDEARGGAAAYQNTMTSVWNEAKALSEKSVFNATEITKGMYTMGQAGYQLQEIYTAIPHFMKLAQAQGAELTTTIEDVVGVMKAYNIDMNEAWRVTNLFAAAATMSRVSMEDFHFGIKYITPVFSELGYSIEQAVSAFTMLTDLGYKGENAGRMLRDAFSDLMNPTAEAMEVISRHNIALYTNQSEMDSLTSTYNQAKDAVAGVKAEQEALTIQMEEQRNVTERLNLEQQRVTLEM
jgi:TP901 family phage tail tape measure protein